jgi:hypothetical protein
MATKRQQDKIFSIFKVVDGKLIRAKFSGDVIGREIWQASGGNVLASSETAQKFVLNGKIGEVASWASRYNFAAVREG